MKKLILAFVILAGISAFTSCKKEWTCECTVFGLTGDTTLTDMSKSDAKAYCDDQHTAAQAFGGSCELK